MGHVYNFSKPTFFPLFFGLPCFLRLSFRGPGINFFSIAKPLDFASMFLDSFKFFVFPLFFGLPSEGSDVVLFVARTAAYATPFLPINGNTWRFFSMLNPWTLREQAPPHFAKASRARTSSPPSSKVPSPAFPLLFKDFSWLSTPNPPVSECCPPWSPLYQVPSS